MKTDFKFGEVFSLASQIEESKDQVKFKNIFENNNGGIGLMAFKAGQALDTHLSPAELMVCVVEGEIEFTMLDNTNAMKAGEFILLGQGVPHSVVAKTDAKVMLVKIKE